MKGKWGIYFILIPNLNILIGPNGSGKSNFIDVLKFLRDCMISRPGDGRGVTEFEDAVVRLGDAKILDATIAPPATVGLEYGFSPTESLPQGVLLKIDLMVKGANSSPVVKCEILSDGNTNVDQRDPLTYYRAHDAESGAGVVSVS